jgi:hypothetical protein
MEGAVVDSKSSRPYADVIIANSGELSGSQVETRKEEEPRKLEKEAASASSSSESSPEPDPARRAKKQRKEEKKAHKAERKRLRQEKKQKEEEDRKKQAAEEAKNRLARDMLKRYTPPPGFSLSCRRVFLPSCRKPSACPSS